MATRYYLHRLMQPMTASLPSTEQSSLSPSQFTVGTFYGISGSVPPFRMLSTDTPHVSGTSQGVEVMQSYPISSGAIWGGWWRTQAFSAGATLTGGTIGLYHGQNIVVASSLTGSALDLVVSGTSPHFSVYHWRPGTGLITSLLNVATGSQPPVQSFAEAYVLSQSFSYPAFTILAGDVLIYETWATSSYHLPADPRGGSVLFNHTYGGNTQNLAHGTQFKIDDRSVSDDPSSWIEFSENLPTLSSPSFSSSQTNMESLIPHPNDTNKLRVQFSAPISTASIDYSNFNLDPYVAVKHAAFVQGTGNTQIDLHFGEEMKLETNTFALWNFNEKFGTTVIDLKGTHPLTTAATIRDDGLLYASRNFNTTAATAATSLQPRNLIISGNFSIEAIIRLTGSRVGSEIVVAYMGNQSGQADNYLYTLYNQDTPGNNPTETTMTNFWQNGVLVSNNYPAATIPTNQMVKVDVVVTTSGSTRSMNTYVNGRKIHTIASATLPDGGTSANMRFVLGAAVNAAADNYFRGFIDSVRITSGSKTDDEISSASLFTMLPLSRGTIYTLSASNVFDLSGSMLQGEASRIPIRYLGEGGLQTGSFSALALGSGSSPNQTPAQFAPADLNALTRTYAAAGYEIQAQINSLVLNNNLSLFVLYDVPCDCSVIGTPPVVSNFVPAAGSNILSSTPVGFDVTDAGPIRRVIILARYPIAGLTEAVHDGTDFGLQYSNISNTRNPIAGGYTYTILRNGGWIESPIISPFAIDVTGSENF